MRFAFVCLCVGFAWLAAAVPASAGVSGCMPASLRHTLNQIEAKFGAVRIVSTFRRNARVRGSGRRSLHADCRAVDFHPPRGRHAAVVAWLRANHRGGLGTYSGRMHHIHIDNGGQYAWHDGPRGHARVAWAGSGGARRGVSRGRVTRVAAWVRRARVASARGQARRNLAHSRAAARYAARTRAGRRIAMRLGNGRARLASRRSARYAAGRSRTRLR